MATATRSGSCDGEAAMAVRRHGGWQHGGSGDVGAATRCRGSGGTKAAVVRWQHEDGVAVAAFGGNVMV